MARLMASVLMVVNIVMQTGMRRAVNLLAMAGCVLFAAVPLGHAGEVELKSLDAGESQEKKYGPYVGVFGGSTTSQDAEMTVDYMTHELVYDVLPNDNAFVMGFEVGYSWRTKHYLELSLEFEGLFSSTEASAALSNTGNEGAPITRGNVVTARTDINYAAFMLNGVMTLDLRKLKPRIGGWIPRLRPYVGGGIGGAQVWFRNQEISTVGGLLGFDTPSDVDVFSTDEFVFAYQIFAGLQIQITDKLAVYGEYRKLMLEKVAELDDFETEMLLGGIVIRY